MTLHELSQLYYLKREIEMDKQRLAELRLAAASPSAPNITGMPKGTSLESTLEKKCEKLFKLEGIINTKITRCECARERMEKYISDIPDSLTRQIFTLRFAHGYTWRQVANRCGGYNTPDGVRKICMRYLQNEQKTAGI